MNAGGKITIDTSAALVLINVAKELANLAEVADNIDRICAEIVPDSCVLLESQSHGLQSVDLLRQTLECLGYLVGNLAEQHPFSGNVAVDALIKDVYLGSIREICAEKVEEDSSDIFWT